MKAADRGSLSSAVALWVLATVATLFFLRAASQLLIPVVLAILVSYVLEPIVAWVARRGVPRLAATAVLMLALLGLAGWGAYSLRDDAVQVVESLPEAARRARQMITSGLGSGAAASVQQAAEELRGTSTAQAGSAGQRAQPTGTAGAQSGAQSGAQPSSARGRTRRRKRLRPARALD